MWNRRIRRSRGRVASLLLLLGVMTAVIILPTAAIQISRQLNRGPEARLVSVERNFFGIDDSYEVDYVQLAIGPKCIHGFDSSGVQYLLVFENGEYIKQQNGEVTLGPTAHWQHHGDEWDSVTLSERQIGYARPGDLIAIDLHFESGQVSNWKTRPFEECRQTDIALVSAY